MKENYTHISVVLDKSASMGILSGSTIEGFNSFLMAQKEVEGEATMTLVQFANNTETVMEAEPVESADELNSRTYRANGGSTSLLDALGRTMNSTETQIEDMEEESPEKVIFVVITDGEENSSREFNRSQIMEMINRHREEDGWEFVFIGANQDAIQSGGGMGIRAGATLSYDQSAIGTRSMYMSLDNSMTNYRSKCVADTINADFFTEPALDANIDKEELLNKNPNPNAKIKGQFQNMYIDTRNDMAETKDTEEVEETEETDK